MKHFLVFAIALALMFGFLLYRPVKPYRAQYAIFNTTGTVIFWYRQDTYALCHEIADRLQQLHNLCNVYDKNSELAILNANAAKAPVQCSPELWEVFQKAIFAYEITDGAFDPSIGPLMHLWGFHEQRNTIPTEIEIADALQKVGFSKIIFDREKHTVYFPIQGMSVDFGGFLKGYACDEVAKILQRYKVKSYQIDLGGNLLLSKEPPPEKKVFSVGIRNPENPEEIIETIDDLDCAYATSGNYERGITIQDRKIGHIMDPRTGMPAPTLGSVTVRTAGNALEADIFSTAVFVAGEELRETIENGGTKVIFH